MANKPKPITSMREMYPALFASMDREIAEYIMQIDTMSSIWGTPLGGFDSPTKDGPFIGPVQEVAPTPPPKSEPPAPSLCACGAEHMGKRVGYRRCGDCDAALAGVGTPSAKASLDQRIAEAQPPKVDKDPTEAWGAGQTPGYEWP